MPYTAPPIHAPLILPHLTGIVPSYEYGTSKELRLLADCAVDAGLLTHLRPGQSVHKAMEAALSRRFRSTIAAIEPMFIGHSLSFSHQIGLDDDDVCLRVDGYAFQPGGLILSNEHSRMDRLIGPCLDEWEAKQPGAGRALLCLLEHGFAQGLGAWTPNISYEQGVGMSMGYTGDEKGALEEARLNWEGEGDPAQVSDEEVAVQYGIWTKSRHRAPDWAFKKVPQLPPTIESLPHDDTLLCLCAVLLHAVNQARDFMRRHPTPDNRYHRKGLELPPNSTLTEIFSAEAAHAAKRQRRPRYRSVNDVYRCEGIATAVSMPVLLHWHQEDCVRGIFDAVAENVMQVAEEVCDIDAIFLFDPAQPATLANALTRLGLCLEVTKATALLLKYISIVW